MYLRVSWRWWRFYIPSFRIHGENGIEIAIDIMGDILERMMYGASVRSCFDLVQAVHVILVCLHLKCVATVNARGR